MNSTALKHNCRLVVRYFHHIRELLAQFKFLGGSVDNLRPTCSGECQFDLCQITVMRASASKDGLRCVCDGKNVFEFLVIFRLWRDCEVVVHDWPFVSSTVYTTFSRLARNLKSSLRVNARCCIAAFTSALSGPYRFDAWVSSSIDLLVLEFSSSNITSRLVILRLFLVLACLDAVFDAGVWA